jgi:hypothetical protein
LGREAPELQKALRQGARSRHYGPARVGKTRLMMTLGEGLRKAIQTKPRFEWMREIANQFLIFLYSP